MTRNGCISIALAAFTMACSASTDAQTPLSNGRVEFAYYPPKTEKYQETLDRLIAGHRDDEAISALRDNLRRSPRDGKARIALARGKPARAARLLAASPALVDPAVPRWPHRRAQFDRIVSAVRARLTEAEFAAARAEGQTRPVEAVIAEALEEALAG